MTGLLNITHTIQHVIVVLQVETNGKTRKTQCKLTPFHPKIDFPALSWNKFIVHSFISWIWYYFHSQGLLKKKMCSTYVYKSVRKNNSINFAIITSFQRNLLWGKIHKFVTTKINHVCLKPKPIQMFMIDTIYRNSLNPLPHTVAPYFIEINFYKRMKIHPIYFSCAVLLL